MRPLPATRRRRRCQVTASKITEKMGENDESWIISCIYIYICIIYIYVNNGSHMYYIYIYVDDICYMVDKIYTYQLSIVDTVHCMDDAWMIWSGPSPRCRASSVKVRFLGVMVIFQGLS